MKQLFFSVFILLTLFSKSYGQAKTKTEQQFLDLEATWMNAWINKDEATVRKIMSEDFLLTSGLTKGELVNKETWIQHALHGFDGQSFGVDSIIVRMYGNTAVLNLWIHQVATINGKDWSGNAMLTDVWIERSGSWQVVDRHATPLPGK
jgi:ketosteroid isomerase-like protein